MIARVLLPIPVDHPFDFTVTDNLAENISIGKRVFVRFQGREQAGVVESLEEETQYIGPLEPVLRISDGPSYDTETLSFCLETAAYYLAPPGPFINRLLPRTANTPKDRFLRVNGGLSEITARIQSLSRRAPRQAEVMRFLLTTQRGALESFLRKKLNTNAGLINRLIEIGLIEEIKDPHLHHKAQVLEKPLTVEDQQKLYSRILLMSSNRMDTYTKEIRKTLLQDQSVLVLLPEILLARTISAKLEERLGDAVLLYHSSLSEGEKGRIWQQAKTNTCVVVGTRSALFLPFRNLGLIIVDQEQDRSYKQDEMIPYFNARDVALRAIQPRIILGSDAPSVETFYHAKKGRLQLNRQLNESLEVTLVDMRNERGMLSSILVESISKTLASGRRVLIGVNARGYFQAVLCKKCGRPLVCPNCGANLTYDVSAAQLVCRVCGKTQPRMVCPNCGSRSLRFVGIGSQRVEEEMRIRFPHAKIIRIDKQSLSNKKSLARAEEAIKRQAQIIIGTPLAAKGPKIDGLGLVAAIGVDNMLARPDFRAAERVYQYLIALFARLDKMGRAIIQTSYPEHYAIVAALNSNYDLFYEHEITEREALFYPPFSHLARLILPHGTDTQRLTQILQEYKLEMVGPAVHPRKQDRDVVLIKAKQSDILRQACKEIRQNISSKTKLEIDIDPDQI